MARGDRKKHKKDLEVFRLELDDELQGNNVETYSRTTLSSSSSPDTMDSIELEAPDLPDDDEDTNGELHESDLEPPIPVGGKKFLEVGESSQSGKRTRGRGAGLVSDNIIRLTNGKIHIEWDKKKNGPHEKKVDIMLSHDIGVARKMMERSAQLQKECASQNPNVPVDELGPLDVNEQIEIFNEFLGERPGEVVCGGGRGVRRERVKEKTSSNSSSKEAEISELKARIIVLEEKIESLSNIEERFMEWMNTWNCRGQPPPGPRDDDMSSEGGSATGLGAV